MRRHLLIFLATFGASASAWAKTQTPGQSPMQSFDPLIGDWQCRAQQMHVGLDDFELGYIEAKVQLHIARLGGSQNLLTHMQATSSTQEPLFDTRTLITYDPQRSLFVQYESTEGGSDATLHTAGFSGPCVTWRYASEADAMHTSKTPDAPELVIEATFCVASAERKLDIEYTLQLPGYAPFVLFEATCQPSGLAD